MYKQTHELKKAQQPKELWKEKSFQRPILSSKERGKITGVNDMIEFGLIKKKKEMGGSYRKARR